MSAFIFYFMNIVVITPRGNVQEVYCSIKKSLWIHFRRKYSLRGIWWGSIENVGNRSVADCNFLMKWMSQECDTFLVDVTPRLGWTTYIFVLSSFHVSKCFLLPFPHLFYVPMIDEWMNVCNNMLLMWLELFLSMIHYLGNKQWVIWYC